MIYLDVTSACHSRLNTGVKRVQRGLHAWLSSRVDYRPVCWQSARNGYRRLNDRDMRTLEQTAREQVRGAGLFDSVAPGLFRDRLDYFRDASLLFPWPSDWLTGDVLLVPDNIWDNRGAFLAGPAQGGMRRVAMFHDAVPLRHPEQSRIDSFLCGRAVRAMAVLDGVVCASREAESDLHFYWRQFGLKPAPTKVVPWPVPFLAARPVSEPNFASRKVLYVARLEPHKNHLRLLAACARLWRESLRFELRLIGCLAYPDAAWRIWRQVRQLQRAGFPVRWQAQVGEAELHQAYQESAFTVYPSLLEGFGLPVIESLWHGRPVVCGGNGALGEVAEGGGCEVVDTRNEASLADGLRRLLVDPAHYQRLCLETRGRRFRSWAHYGAEILPFLEKPA